MSEIRPYRQRRRATGRRSLPTRLVIGLGAVGIIAGLVGCEPAPIAGQGYELVFEDEFDGDGPRSVWATAPFGGSLPPTVADGMLTLRSTAANNRRWGYLASTGPRSAQEPNYPAASSWQEGYFEARIRFTDDPWAWPAFWLFSMSKTEAWPGEDCSHLTAEWDIMENGIGNANGDRPPSKSVYSVLHRNTTDNTPDGYCGVPDESQWIQRTFPDANLSDWHTWGGLWTEDEVCAYLDGVELGCLTPYDSTAQPMHLIFTIQFQGLCGGCPPRPDELELQVDWVRVWQRP